MAPHSFPRALARPVRRFPARGTAAVEFGLVALVLVPLVMGTVEFGRALYAYDALVKSVRSAARHLSVGRATDLSRQQEAACIVVTGSPAHAAGACSGTEQLAGLTTAMVNILVPDAVTPNAVTAVATGSGALSMVTVSVTGYPLSNFAPILYSGITLGAISVTVPFVFF